MTDAVRRRPIVRRDPWELDRWRLALHGRAGGVECDGPAGRLRVTPEPLIRLASDGRELQPLRVTALSEAGLPSRLEVVDGAGTPIPAVMEPAPGGDVRVLLPAVAAPIPVRLVGHGGAGRTDVAVTVPVVRRWTVHLIHHSHFDIGYTDPQPVVIANQLAYLDAALDLATATDDRPVDARFRWCAESLWPVLLWAERRPAERVADLVQRVRERRIELSALPFNLHTEACSTTELFELLRDARDVGARWGTPLVSAMQTDVPGAVGALPDALGEGGVRYLSVAHNWAGLAAPHLVGDPPPRLFRWRGPAGHEVLTWMTDTPLGLAYAEGALLGFTDSLDHVDDLLPAYLGAIAMTRSPYGGEVMGHARADAAWSGPGHESDLLHLRVVGRMSDNAAPSRAVSDIVRDWSGRWAWPRLRLSTTTDFFEAAEARLGATIPTLSGDWNDWWTVGLGSAAQELALQREAQAAAMDAATVISLAAALGAARPTDLDARRRATQLSLALFDEHTWGAADPWGDDMEGLSSGRRQWAWKAARAHDAHDRAGSLLDDARFLVGTRVGRSPDALAGVAVINPSGWPRTGAVAAFVPDSVVPLEIPVDVRDGRSGEVLAADEAPPDNDEHREAGRVLRFVVADVPPVGVVRCDLVPATAARPAGDAQPAAVPDPLVLRNSHLLVTVDPERACIGSIVYVRTGRELVDPASPFGFGAYVHDRYVPAGLVNHASSRLVSSERLELLGNRSLSRPAFVRRRTTVAGDVLELEHGAEGVRTLRTTITLALDAAILDLVVRVAKDPTTRKESGYIAFPFALREPVVRIDVTGGIVGSGIPVVPGGAPHARAMRDWVSLESDGLAVAWATRDAALVHVGGLPLPFVPYPPTIDPEPGLIVSWIHDNVWDTNFPAEQGFDRVFRYRVAIGLADGPDPGPRLAREVAAATSHPLLAIVARGVPVADATASLLSVANPAVIVEDVVPMGDRTVLVRLRSLADASLTTAVVAGLPVRAAQQATYLGDPAEDAVMVDGSPTITLAPRATGALLLTLDGTLA